VDTGFPWQGRLEEHGVDEDFHVAIRALQTGWDDPALAAVIAGKVFGPGTWVTPVRRHG
jgi:hypothetical protein